jgi:hypothetical protein
MHQGRLKGLRRGVFTNSANEARGAPSSHGCHGNVGGAPAASSCDLGGGVGAAPPRCVQPHGNLVD